MRRIGFVLLSSSLLFLPACSGPPAAPVCGEGESLVPVGQPDSDDVSEVCAPAACGTEAWASTDATDVVYAAPWGGTTGPGTREAPFGIVQRAIGAAGDGGTVLVADGEYVWDLLTTPEEGADVTILGRCAELVTITPRDPEAPSLWVQGATVEVHGVTLSGGQGVQVMRSADGAMNGSLTLRDAVIADAHQIGVQAITGSTLNLTDVTIRGTRPLDGDGSVVALKLNTGSRGALTRVDFVQNMGSVIEASGSNTVLDLEDIVIRDTVPRTLLEDDHDDDARWHSEVMSGIMIVMGSGTVLNARGLSLLDNAGDGISLVGPAGPHVLEDVTISGMLDAYPPPLDLGRSGGSGLMMDARSLGQDMDVTVRNLLVERCTWIGVSLAGQYLTADFEGVVLRNMLPSAHDGAATPGLVTFDRAPVSISDMQVDDTGYAGVFIADGSEVTLDNVDITGTTAGMAPGGGMGLLVVDEAVVHAAGLRISDSEGAGMLVMPDARIEGTDVQITRSGMADAVVLGGELRLSDASLSGATASRVYGGGLGLFALDFRQPPRIVLDDVSFSDTVGPGVYLRGNGSYEIRDSSFSDSGDIRGVPGGIFATEGVQAWVPGENGAPGVGLLIEGNSFDGMGLDGILLDDAGATLADNTFGDVAGEPLFVQRCSGGTLPVDVAEQTGVDATCRPQARIVESLLLYGIFINDSLTQ